MPAAHRLGDNNTGHDSCPSVALSTASSNVITNGRGQGRLGDSYNPHSCKVHPSHSGTVSSASSTVFVNGRGAARIGDSVSCGGTAAEGSENVFIGG